MNRRFAELLIIGLVVLSAVLVIAGAMALRSYKRRAQLRAWAPTAADHPAWAAALAEGSPRWQISRPTADSIQVEYQIGTAETSLYTAAIRERDVTSASISAQVFLAAQLEAIGDDPEWNTQMELGIRDSGDLYVDESHLIAVARRGNVVLIINANGLPPVSPWQLEPILERQFETILAAP